MPERSVSAKGLFFSAIIAILLIVGCVYGIDLRDAAAIKPKHFTIVMTDYAFNPSVMTWHVGDTVTVTVKNDSQSTAGTIHEFMIGRNPNTGDEGFGKTVTDGFETPFFTGFKVKLIAGTRMLQIMPGKARLTGINPKNTLASNPPGVVLDGEDFMMVFAAPVHGENPKPGGSLTFQFKVPDTPGKWEMGCFQGSGSHLKDGMRGTINIVK